MDNATSASTTGQLISAGEGLAGGIISLVGTNMLADKQNAANNAMWHEQTAYNSPVAQMTRLAKAGLNPNLVYGNGVVAGSATPPPSQVVGSMPDVGGEISKYAQVTNTSANTENAIIQKRILASNALAASSDATTAKARADIATHDASLYTPLPIPSNASPVIMDPALVAQAVITGKKSGLVSSQLDAAQLEASKQKAIDDKNAATEAENKRFGGPDYSRPGVGSSY